MPPLPLTRTALQFGDVCADRGLKLDVDVTVPEVVAIRWKYDFMSDTGEFHHIEL